MTIKMIRIKNFQRHKNKVIKFHENVNVIVGFSDRGKSSIIRALLWCLTNQPSGDEFRKWGSKETSVIVVMENGVKIKRVRSNTVNSYFLNDQEFKAFGQGVPVEIEKEINMQPINIREQLDPPFLLTESPTEVAKFLNASLGMQNIDDSFLAVNKEINNQKSMLKYYKTTQDEKNKLLMELGWVREVEPKINELKKKEKQLIVLDVDWEALNGLIINLDRIQEDRNNIPLYVEAPVKPVLKLISDWRKIDETYVKLNRLLNDINMAHSKKKKYTLLIRSKKPLIDCLDRMGVLRGISDEYKKLKLKINLWEDVCFQLTQNKNKFDGVPIKLKLVQDVRGKLNEVCQQYSKIKKLVMEAIQVKKDLKRMSVRVLDLQKKLDNNFPNICPLCGLESERI